jgi:hypothetical protein
VCIDVDQRVDETSIPRCPPLHPRLVARLYLHFGGTPFLPPASMLTDVD